MNELITILILMVIFVGMAFTIRHAWKSGYDTGYNEAKKECQEQIEKMKDLYK